MTLYQISPLSAAVLLTTLSHGALAAGKSVTEFNEIVSEGTAALDLRYRFEGVDQDGIDDDAEASALRSRLTLTTASFHGFTVKVEADDVTSVGPNDYNSTENGETDYPVVADPEGTDLNQAWLQYEEQGGFASGRTVNNSTDTYGIEYSGKLFDMVTLAATYATQSDGGDSEQDYEADYYMAEAGVNVAGFTVKAAYEVLGSDNGVGFKTPLATLHKFQGWADKFLGTPGAGIEDAYVSVAGKIGPVKVAAIYHDFQAESSSEDWGSELDLVATWPVLKYLTLQAKYASFDSDAFTDTDKIWLTAQLKL